MGQKTNTLWSLCVGIGYFFLSKSLAGERKKLRECLRHSPVVSSKVKFIPGTDLLYLNGDWMCTKQNEYLGELKRSVTILSAVYHYFITEIISFTTGNKKGWNLAVSAFFMVDDNLFYYFGFLLILQAD